MASVFHFRNGQIADTVLTLIKVLETLDEDAFKHHCNEDKNDFFNWLSTDLNDAEAAAAVKTAKTRKTMHTKLKQILGINSVKKQKLMLGRSDQDAKDWVAKAITLYKTSGKEMALSEFSKHNGPFIQDEMYIFVLDLKGIMLAHGVDEKYIGEDFIDIKDYAGKRFIIEIVEIANTRGIGFVEYAWYDPIKEKGVPKRLYFEKVDDLIICSGVYRKMWEEQY